MYKINKTIADLIAQAKADSNKVYESNWQANAVAVLNDYYEEQNCCDDRIYDLESYEWNDIVKYNLEKDGWLAVKRLLEDINDNAEYAQIDVYGYGRDVDDDLLDMLENAKEGY